MCVLFLQRVNVTQSVHEMDCVKQMVLNVLVKIIMPEQSVINVLVDFTTFQYVLVSC
jgi:hypothetical protein